MYTVSTVTWFIGFLSLYKTYRPEVRWGVWWDKLGTVAGTLLHVLLYLFVTPSSRCVILKHTQNFYLIFILWFSYYIVSFNNKYPLFLLVVACHAETLYYHVHSTYYLIFNPNDQKWCIINPKFANFSHWQPYWKLNSEVSKMCLLHSLL